MGVGVGVDVVPNVADSLFQKLAPCGPIFKGILSAPAHTT